MGTLMAWTITSDLQNWLNIQYYAASKNIYIKLGGFDKCRKILIYIAH